MERFAGTKSKSFKWTKSGRLASSLTGDGRVYATVTWAKRMGTLATGVSADGTWTLKRVGFLRPRVTVREAGSSSDLAVVSMDWSGGGTIAFMDAATFRFRRVGFWRPEWILLDSTGKGTLSMKPSGGWKRGGATLEIVDERARSSWRTSLLSIIGWYLSVLISQYDYEGGGTVAVMAVTGI